MLLVKKMSVFSLFVFSQNKTRNKVYKSSRKKTDVFIYYKEKTFQSSKYRIFSKGLTRAFGQKGPFISLFVFAQNRLEIMLNKV